VFDFRLRWLWNAWAKDAKPWVRLGNPCTLKDHDLFTTSTLFTVGNGENDIFLGSAWLNGMLPKDIALKIYEIASEKKCTVNKALDNELLVSHINTQNGLSVEQITQFYKLWEILQGVHIYHDTPDRIAWKFGKKVESIRLIRPRRCIFYGSHHLSDSLNGLEILGTSLMQELIMASAPNMSLDHI
jgi:hypothetical protein